MSTPYIDDAAYLDAAKNQGDFEVESAKTRAKISGGVLAAQILLRNSLSDKEDEISQRQLAVAESLRSQLRKFWDVDKGLIVEACASPVPITPYELKDTFIGLVGEPDCDNTNTYCEQRNECLDPQLAVSMATHKVDTANFAMRYAESRQRALNDLRWTKKMNSLKSARGISSVASSMAEHSGAISRGALLGGILSAAYTTAGMLLASKPITPQYQGMREYSWGGQPTVAPNEEPITVAISAPVRMPSVEPISLPALDANQKDAAIKDSLADYMQRDDRAAANHRIDGAWGAEISKGRK